jgi:hypothetical protein
MASPLRTRRARITRPRVPQWSHAPSAISRSSRRLKPNVAIATKWPGRASADAMHGEQIEPSAAETTSQIRGHNIVTIATRHYRYGNAATTLNSSTYPLLSTANGGHIPVRFTKRQTRDFPTQLAQAIPRYTGSRSRPSISSEYVTSTCRIGSSHVTPRGRVGNRGMATPSARSLGRGTPSRFADRAPIRRCRGTTDGVHDTRPRGCRRTWMASRGFRRARISDSDLTVTFAKPSFGVTRF